MVESLVCELICPKYDLPWGVLLGKDQPSDDNCNYSTLEHSLYTVWVHYFESAGDAERWKGDFVYPNSHGRHDEEQ